MSGLLLVILGCALRGPRFVDTEPDAPSGAAVLATIPPGAGELVAVWSRSGHVIGRRYPLEDIVSLQRHRLSEDTLALVVVLEDGGEVLLKRGSPEGVESLLFDLMEVTALEAVDIIPPTVPLPEATSAASPELGSLGKDEIDARIKRHMSQIRYCYQQELSRDRELSGKVVVQFIIDRDGQVPLAFIKSTTMNSPKTERCITERFQVWRFPRPPDEGIVIVSYPFVFAPR